jgi:AcrR family transcriptional regulator
MSSRLSGPERRQTILTESQQLFAAKGFHGVSIDEIARAVNVSPAILYRHFDSKQTLYNAVLAELSSQRESYVNTVINSGTSFEDVLTGMTHVFISSIDDNPNLLRIEMQSLLEGNPATQEFFQNRWKSFTDYIEFGLNQKLSRELPNREITILSASLMFQGMVREALLQKYMRTEDRLTDISMPELSQELVRLFLRAVGIEKSRISRKAVIATA